MSTKLSLFAESKSSISSGPEDRRLLRVGPRDYKARVAHIIAAQTCRVRVGASKFDDLQRAKSAQRTRSRYPVRGG